MDIISLHYFLELTKDFNITKTANRLYISQQTLSNHILRLEQYYGTRLLHRKPVLSLTCAGESLLPFARMVDRENGNLKRMLSDIEQQERGLLCFGASAARAKYLLTNVLPIFYKRYPKVQIQFMDYTSHELEVLVRNGEVDFAVVLDGINTSELMRRPLFSDQVYLCVPEGLLLKYYSEEEAAQLKRNARKGVQLRDFLRLPFSVLANRLGEQMSEYFPREDGAFNIYFTGTYSYQSLALCAAGITACYCTQMCLLENWDALSREINIFPLLHQDEFIYQRLSLVWSEQRYLTHHAKYFSEVMVDTIHEMERIDISRVVEAEELIQTSP